MNRLTELYKVRDILNKVDYKTLTQILNSYLPEITGHVFEFENKDFALRQIHAGGMNMLYRARLLDKSKIPFQKIQDISFVAPHETHKIEYYGRANKPGHSMFYASTKLETACIETFSRGESFDKLKEKNSLMLVVGTWRIINPMTLVQMTAPEKYFNRFLEEAKNLNLKKVTIEDIKNQNNSLKKLFNSKEDYEILNFFSEEFAKTDILDHNEYKLSNYYADRIFGEGIKSTKKKI